MAPFIFHSSILERVVKFYHVNLDGHCETVEASDEADAIRLAKLTSGIVDVCHPVATECEPDQETLEALTEETDAAKKPSRKKKSEPTE